ncbi:Elongation factor Ts mitochondrial, partial [Bienertia sinuspersici]
KSIDKACRYLWPEVRRRYCTKHLSVNFKKAFPGPKMFQLFWLASGAYNDFTFKKAMDQIDKYKVGARVWLANLGDQDRWSKHKFNASLKCDVNKTNFVESFNATLGIDR